MRIIPKDMPWHERFLVGDTVAHFTNGDGIVTANTGSTGYIQVTYERKYPRTVEGLGGKPIVQNYSGDSFRRLPRMLWHTGEIIPIEESK